MGICQRDNNPTKEQIEVEGHQWAARKFRTRRKSSEAKHRSEEPNIVYMVIYMIPNEVKTIKIKFNRNTRKFHPQA